MSGRGRTPKSARQGTEVMGTEVYNSLHHVGY